MAEQYIFNADAEKSFYDKLDGFHDKYVYHVLLSGTAKKGQDLESIKMTKNPKVNDAWAKKVIGGLVNIKPSVILRLVEDRQTRLECVITHLKSEKEHPPVDCLCMIQNVIDWPQLDKFSCQIWYLGQTSVNEVKQYWND